jgi:hypothetical protein
MSIKTILQTHAQRWSLEVAFRDTKQQLGFGRSQARRSKAVESTTPFAFAAYTITVAWLCRFGHQHYPTLPIMPCYRHKGGPSFADMQTLLRRERLNHGLSPTPANIHPLKQPKRANTHAHRRAA